MERIGQQPILPRFGAFLVLVVALVPALGWWTPATSHSELVGSHPAADATVTSLPRITLTFSKEVEAAGSHLWIERDGQALPLGPVAYAGGDTKVLAAPVPQIAIGAYAIGFHVIARDGDPVSGSIPFTLGAASAGATVEAGPDATSPTPSAPTPVAASAAPSAHHDADLPVGAARILLDASLATLVGGIAFVASVWPQGATSRGTRRLLWGAAVGAAAASIVLATQQHAVAIGIGIGEAFRPAHLQAMLDFRFGRVALARFGLLAIVCLLLTRLRQLPRRGAPAIAAIAIGTVLALGLFETVVLLSHDGGTSRLDTLARLVHTVGVSIWLGGLVMLLGFVLPRRRRDELIDVLPRFSQLATAAVALVLVAGVVLADGLVGGVSGLATTDYGRILLLKVALVLGLLEIARRSRSQVRVALSDSSGALARPLATWVAIELALMALVFALTALLVSQQPPA
jgi:copper transport protein